MIGGRKGTPLQGSKFDILAWKFNNLRFVEDFIRKRGVLMRCKWLLSLWMEVFEVLVVSLEAATEKSWKTYVEEAHCILKEPSSGSFKIPAAISLSSYPLSKIPSSENSYALIKFSLNCRYANERQQHFFLLYQFLTKN